MFSANLSTFPLLPNIWSDFTLKHGLKEMSCHIPYFLFEVAKLSYKLFSVSPSAILALTLGHWPEQVVVMQRWRPDKVTASSLPFCSLLPLIFFAFLFVFFFLQSLRLDEVRARSLPVCPLFPFFLFAFCLFSLFFAAMEAGRSTATCLSFCFCFPWCFFFSFFAAMEDEQGRKKLFAIQFLFPHCYFSFCQYCGLALTFGHWPQDWQRQGNKGYFTIIVDLMDIRSKSFGPKMSFFGIF